MSQLALAHDALLPRAPGGQAPGAALSLFVHLGLVAALTVSVDWRAKTPEVFSAELWSSVPQSAAPAEVAVPAPPPVPLPAPPPAPVPRTEASPEPKPDIAIERAREKPRKVEPPPPVHDTKKADAERKKVELERKRADDERRQADDERKLAEQQQREAKAEDARLARQRADNLRRMMGQAGSAGPTGTAPGGTGTAVHSAGPSAAYAGKVIAKVRPNIVFTGTVPGNPATEIEVRSAPGGTILSSRIVKTSGHADWDEAVLRAVEKTPALPADTDGRVPPTLIIAFRRD